MYFVKATSTKSVSFITIASLFFIAIVFCSLFFKFFKFKKEKLIRLKNSNFVMYISLSLSILIGIIYLSLINFNVIDLTKNHITWLFESISFVYSLGMYIVCITFFCLWFLIPVIIWKGLSNFFNKNTLIKFGFIILFMFISLSISNIQWAIPFNNKSSDLSILSLNNDLYTKDYFLIGVKKILDNLFLTEWYPWLFVGYCTLLFLIFSLFKFKLDRQDNKQTDKTTKVTTFLSLPYVFIDNFSNGTLFLFMICYLILNPISLLIHISLMLLLLILTYGIINIILLIWIGIKFKSDKDKFLFIKYKLIDNNKKYNLNFKYWDKKIENSIAKEWALLETIVVGLIFTTYLGFANLYSIKNSVVHYSSKLHSANFWTSLIFSSILFSLIDNQKQFSNSSSKVFLGNTTYAITPGLQTGIFGFLSPILKKMNNLTNTLVCMVI